MSLDMNELWKHAVRMSISRVFWEEHYAKIEDLQTPYLRDYYYVQLGVAGLGLVDAIEAEYAKDLMEDLIQMRVNAEIDPDDPKNKETLSDLAEFKKTIRDLKPKIVQSMGISMSDFDERMHEAALDQFNDYDDAESDDEESQFEDHEESLEVDSDVFVDPSLINVDKLYDSIVYLFSKRNIVGEESKNAFFYTTLFSNDDYNIGFSKSIELGTRYITVIENSQNESIANEKLNTLFDGSDSSKIIWEALKTFNIKKSQLKSIYDNEIPR